MLNLKYLVTGTGRCGTVYLSRLLTSLGIPCGHESVFDWRGIEHARKKLSGEILPEFSYVSRMKLHKGKWIPDDAWLADSFDISAESSYMAAPFLGEINTTVIHLVRDPNKVVQSFVNHIDYFQSEIPTNAYERFIYHHVPELTEKMHPFDRAALFYVRWNEMIEKHRPELFHRVEDGSEKIMEFLNVTGECYNDSKANTFEKWCDNNFAIHKITDPSIRQQFVEMGLRYGYKMPVVTLI